MGSSLIKSLINSHTVNQHHNSESASIEMYINVGYECISIQDSRERSSSHVKAPVSDLGANVFV